MEINVLYSDTHTFWKKQKAKQKSKFCPLCPEVISWQWHSKESTQINVFVRYVTCCFFSGGGLIQFFSYSITDDMLMYVSLDEHPDRGTFILQPNRKQWPSRGHNGQSDIPLFNTWVFMSLGGLCRAPQTYRATERPIHSPALKPSQPSPTTQPPLRKGHSKVMQEIKTHLTQPHIRTFVCTYCPSLTLVIGNM